MNVTRVGWLSAVLLGLACGGQDKGSSEAETCFSPTRNAAQAYQSGAHGCSCNTATTPAAGACVEGTALLCEQGHWVAVEDGPCFLTNHGTDTTPYGMPSGTPDTSPDASRGTTPDASPGVTCAPPGTPLSADASCPPGFSCHVESTLTCQVRQFAPDECVAVGGTVLTDRGDGSLTPSDCRSGTALGAVTVGGEGGLCCAARACGARAGNTCSESEYCAYEAGEYCGGADAEAVCKPRPTGACIDLYAPVCGCDQRTYSNSCVAAQAGTGIWTAGSCE